MSTTNLLDWIKVILQIISVLIGIGILKWAKKKYNHYRANRDQGRIFQAQQMALLMKEVTAVKMQVQPNGGASLNDKITQVATRLDCIDKTLIELKTGQRNNREIQDIASWESDQNGHVDYVSVALCDLIGCTQTDILVNGWVGLVDADDRKRVFDEWKESVNTGYEFNSTFNFRKSDGMYQRVRATALHNKDEAGKVVSTLCRLIKIDEPFKK